MNRNYQESYYLVMIVMSKGMCRKRMTMIRVVNLVKMMKRVW